MPRTVVTLQSHKLGRKKSEELLYLLENKEGTQEKADNPQVLEIISSRTHRFTSSRGSGHRKNPFVRKASNPLSASALQLPTNLSKRLVLHCATEDKKQSDVVASAVEIYLDSARM